MTSIKTKGATQVQARAYEGYFEDGKFFVGGKQMHIPERRKAFVTVLNEPAKNEQSPFEWLQELHELLDKSGNDLLDMNDFPRFQMGREPVVFSNEE